jgi:uncharacterized protein YigE (DUF2233 family)
MRVFATSLLCGLLLLVFKFKRELNIVKPTKTGYISYTVDMDKQDIKLYWKKKNGDYLWNLGNVKEQVEDQGKELVLAMNAGMFHQDLNPVGLFIQDGLTIKRINRASGKWNFSWKPNGVFYITDENRVKVCRTENFVNNRRIKYATQSGPMLIADGVMHRGFRQSTGKNIRNGVGILPGNKAIFAISRGKVTFFEFAQFFKDKGCRNALFFDGCISQAYIPEKGITETGGFFGVMVGVTNK